MLLLDEPTNDLDVETLRALEEAILDFPGNAMVISHDRWFLDRVATHILAFEDSGEAVWHEGNYREYEDDFRRRTGSETGVNRRSRNKKDRKSDVYGKSVYVSEALGGRRIIKTNIEHDT